MLGSRRRVPGVLHDMHGIDQSDSVSSIQSYRDNAPERPDEVLLAHRLAKGARNIGGRMPCAMPRRLEKVAPVTLADRVQPPYLA